MRVIAVVALLVASAFALAPLHTSKEPIGNSYIVVFNQDVTADDVLSHLDSMTRFDQAAHGVFHTYSMKHFKGYAATLNSDALAAVRASSAVKYVETDSRFHTQAPVKAIGNDSCVLQKEATWGLVRTVDHDLKIDGKYVYHSNAGENVKAYVIDTGVLLTHVEFEGRATWGFDAIDDPSPKTDLNGHGTHCAGIIAAKTWGVAKDASIVAVRVLDADGSGPLTSIIKGIEWVEKDAGAHSHASVASMSLGGLVSAASNDAVAALWRSGVPVMVAAGNDGEVPILSDACYHSPASEAVVVTVGSSNNKDERSYFSNVGTCVDIFAPGSAITSCWIGSNDATNTISGTSMATPFVAGVAAKYLTAHPSTTPDQLKTHLLSSATFDKLTDIKEGSPNKLLFADCS
jgi:subtilisin family serine protease